MTDPTPPALPATSARAALAQQITEQITAQTGDPAIAAARAAALVTEKRRRTRSAIYLGLTGAGLAFLSHRLGLPGWFTLACTAGGALGAGVMVSPEYFKAWAKDFAEVVLTLGGAVGKAKGGGA